MFLFSVFLLCRVQYFCLVWSHVVSAGVQHCGQCWSVEKQTKRRQRVLVRERIWSLNCWKSCKCDDTNDKSVFWWLARRTKDSRFLSVKCWGRREGKYSQWRGRTTQCQLDSLFYISIWASTKIQNTFTKIQNTLRNREKEAKENTLNDVKELLNAHWTGTDSFTFQFGPHWIGVVI